MEKVHIVTIGEYSDYHIVAVFTNVKKLRKFIKVNSKFAVEVYEANPKFFSPAKDMQPWHVSMYRNGQVDYAYQPENIDFFKKLPEAEHHLNRTWKRWLLHWFGWARSKEHAIKITNEIRAQLIANNEWEEDEKMAGPESPANDE